jgi:methylenetetrahydrofolate--tRNA-(uracil-5-)-methyltransferase
MFFYDAIAPIVTASSIDMSIAYYGSRYDHGDQAKGDYINCPMDKETYYQFVEALMSAQRIPLKEFENSIDQGVKAGSGEFFEGCLPVEVLACRNPDTLQFGPMRPVGLTNPHTGMHPFAVVQLRQENFSGELFNMVGFQTNLAYSEQKRVFQMIPGLKHTEFTRYGHMHRNTYIASPLFLQPTMQFKSRDNLFFAGQISGIEGYMGNAASGLLAGLNASRLLMKQPLLELPATTMIGALCGYITLSELKTFQPMKANFGILPPLDLNIRNKRERYNMYATRALNDLKVYLSSI